MLAAWSAHFGSVSTRCTVACLFAFGLSHHFRRGLAVDLSCDADKPDRLSALDLAHVVHEASDFVVDATEQLAQVFQ